MPRMLITKQESSNERDGALRFELKSGSYGICEAYLAQQNIGIDELLSENKPEAFSQPYSAGSLRKFDSEWEHQIKTNNPDDFPAPESNLGVQVAGCRGGSPPIIGDWYSFWTYSKIGTPGGDFSVLDTFNRDINETATSATIYAPNTSGGGSSRGPGGFNPPDQGIANIGGETVHYGSLGSSIGSLGRVWGAPGLGPYGGSPFWGFPHYGHDYENNPFPPPAQIVVRKHDSVGIWYPPRWINMGWMATSRSVEMRVDLPVSYAPKGAKCGTFMPMIVRFLIMKRKNKLVTITAGAKP